MGGSIEKQGEMVGLRRGRQGAAILGVNPIASYVESRLVPSWYDY
ncbi:hypothetical protein GMJAKD_03065 [Candidatus Electrothrix aarhusensis]